MKKLKLTSVEAASVNTHGNLLTVATATPFVSHTVARLLHSMQSRLCFCMTLQFSGVRLGRVGEAERARENNQPVRHVHAAALFDPAGEMRLVPHAKMPVPTLDRLRSCGQYDAAGHWTHCSAPLGDTLAPKKRVSTWFFV